MTKLASFQDRVALVTGASTGIGRLLALRLAGEGAKLALVARRQHKLRSVASEIASLGGESLVLPCDVSRRNQVFDAARQALDRYGAVDLLVNNAGYGHYRRFLNWSVDDMEQVMRVNYFGAMYWTKALLPQMVQRKEGWIVFVASAGGRLAVPEETAYSASKFAMVGLAEALSMEVEDAGVHVLIASPGTVRTDFHDKEAWSRMPPAAEKRMMAPVTVVDAIIDALARGKHEIVLPRSIAAALLVKAAAPRFVRRAVKRNTIDALPEPPDSPS